MPTSHSRLRCAFVLALTANLSNAGNLLAAQRAIPGDNLAYPVLITLRNGPTGSGFYLNTDKAIYLVTAKHVLFDPATKKLRDTGLELLSYSRDPSDSTHNLFALDLSILQNEGNIKPHPSEDVVVVKIGTLGKGQAPGTATTASGTTFPVSGVTMREIAKAGILGVDLSNVTPFEKVLTGNDVMVFGYPTSLGLQQLPQIDTHRPLLRKGIVAGTNPQNQSIVLDCPTYFGNSGGPVVEVDKGAFTTHFTVIGVVLQYVPFAESAGSSTVGLSILTNSGYSIAAPMNPVQELVK